MPEVSIIIPAYNAESTLDRALQALGQSEDDAFEVIVVDDGSIDGTSAICTRFAVSLIRLAVNGGPAHARNLAARTARGKLLLFLDADTCLESGGLEKIKTAFDSDPSLDGLIGAYDDEPAAPGTLSQYRNLLHCYVHRSARRQASTFWSGCGAIRSHVFLGTGGFDESYRRASIEDLEFGYRLRHAGKEVAMHPEIRVKHLKHWTFSSMLSTDVRDRAIPWTQLILRERFMPDDLNVGIGQRLSVLGVFAALLLLAVSPFSAAFYRHTQWIAAFLLLLSILVINRGFYFFLYSRRGLRFTAQAIALHLLFYFYNGVSFVIGLFCWMYGSGPIRGLRRRLTAIFAG